MRERQRARRREGTLDEPAPYRTGTHRTAGPVVGKPGVGACSERGDERLDERDGVVHQLS